MTDPVLIVGAGPTGLTAALELSRMGVTVRLIDKREAPATTSRARTERAGQHGGAHLYVDLPCERRAARPIELPSVEVGPSAQCHRKKSAASGLL